MGRYTDGARALRSTLNALSSTLSDEQALEYAIIYEPLRGDGVAIQAGERRRFNGELYKANQTIWDRPEYNPLAAPQYWTKITQSDGVEDWVQPLGSHDAYSIGDVRAHAGKIWRSIVNGNVWEPGIYGWEEVK